MALVDSILNLVNKQPKDPDAPKPPVGSRSEREAKLKDKAGMVHFQLLQCNKDLGNSSGNLG